MALLDPILGGAYITHRSQLAVLGVSVWDTGAESNSPLKALKNFGHWIIASPSKEPQAPQQYRLVRVFHSICQEIRFLITGEEQKTEVAPEPWKLQRGFTIAKRVGIVIGAGLGTAAALYGAGRGMQYAGQALKEYQPQLELIQGSLEERVATGLTSALGSVGKNVTMLSQKVFLGVSVPLYGIGYVAPKWAYENGMPAVTSLFNNAKGQLDGYLETEKESLNTYVYEPLTSLTKQVVAPLVGLTIETAGEVATKFCTLGSKMSDLFKEKVC